ncbi:MAG: transglutaminase domain-containing protein, partial [Bacteroidota bacterium]|nr:transglutaminase domain-containing protein [Bacteroidota bacterium]
SEKAAFEKAQELGIDKERVWELLQKSRGNWNEILSYLEKAKDKPYLLSLLENIADKDLRDTPSEILLDHLNNFDMAFQNSISEEELMQFVLSPRIKNEIIVAYRSYFQNKFDKKFKADCRQDFMVLVDWINQNIRINNEKQYYDLPITPIGVYELKRSNVESRSIFFVAACRSFGIPARFDLSTHVPQVLKNGEWLDVFFSDEKEKRRDASISFKLKNFPGFDPEYYIHFTLAAINDNGFKTLEFDYNKKWNSFPERVKLFPGRYMLTSGNRIKNGEILSNVSFFNLNEGEHKNIIIPVRTQQLEINTIAEFALENIYNIATNKEVEIREDEAFVAIFIDPGKEPTRHVFADLVDKVEDFNRTKIPLYFILPDEKMILSFSKENYKIVPDKSNFCVDKGNSLFRLENQINKKISNDLPVVLLFQEQGRIIYLSYGYKFGLPGEILKYLSPK